MRPGQYSRGGDQPARAGRAGRTRAPSVPYRDIWVLDAERLTRTLTNAIADPPLRTLLNRLRPPDDRGVGRLPGAIDQAIDSVDVLIRPARRRAVAAVLGRP